MDKLLQTLFDFIEQSPTPYHATESIAKILEKEDFQKLSDLEPWTLKSGGCYYLTKDQTSIIGFKIGQKSHPTSCRIVASHNDTPGFKIKPNGLIEAKNYYQLNTEVYGGPIYTTWLDRLLKIGGRVLVRTKDGIKSKVVCLKESVLIAELAIHLNRNVNNGVELNPQIDLLPLLASKDVPLTWKSWLETELGQEEIIAHDLFLYNPQKGEVWSNENFFSAPRIDNLECAFTTLKGFLQSSNDDIISIYACFNNEEIGSQTKQGAASTFLFDTISRIASALKLTEEEKQCLLARSIIISADNAHAQHPNRPDKTDPVNYTLLNKGVVIKHSARQSYTTDAMSSSIFQTICELANVPYQNYTNRSDERGGGTLGAISASQVSITSIDIGLAQLAMHSAYETAGAKDASHMVNAITAFFNTKFEKSDDGWKL